MTEYTNEDLLSKVLNRQDFTSEGSAVLKSPQPKKSALLPKAHNSDIDVPDFEPNEEFFDKELATIIFPASFTKEIESFLETVDGSTIVFNKEYLGFLFLANKQDIDAYVEKYQKTDQNKKNAPRIDTDFVPVMLHDMIKSMRGEIHDIFAHASARNKINFLYLLCSGDLVSGDAYEHQLGFDTVIKQFMLKQLSIIENLKTDEEKNESIIKLADRFIINPNFWNANIKQFNTTIGELRFTNPVSMEVVLSDGTFTDLFKLDTSKKYRIMTSVNFSKIKHEIDLSNLSINGKFMCENAKARVIFPERINGVFVCSHYKFPITRIPNGATTADLTHSIKSFADLNKIEIPSSLTCIMLTRSLILNAVKDLNELEEIDIFVHNHPNITICDNQNRISLLEVLKQQQQKSQEKQIEKKQTVVEKRPVIAEKTDDWIPRKQIVEILSTDERFSDVADLPKLIQRATNINTSITEQKLLDSIPVLCVHKNNVPVVINAALDLMNKDKMRAQKQDSTDTETIGKSKKEKKNKTKKVKSTDTKIIHIEKPKPIDIEKYIPKNVWKDICDSCKDSSQLLYSVLEKISLINMDYTKQQKSGTVQYIDADGQMQVISSISKKGGCALGQSINPSDRKRIVWTMNPSEKIMVATAFLETHAETIRAVVPYKTARTLAAKGQTVDGTLVTRDLVIKNNYLKVSDLLEQYKPEKIDEIIPVAESEPNNEVENHIDNNPIIPDNTPVQSAPVSPVIKEEEEKHPVESTKNQPNVQNKIQKSRTKRYELVDVKSTQVIIDAAIDKLNEQIIQLSIDIYNQRNNPREQLCTLKTMETLIKKKIRYMSK